MEMLSTELGISNVLEDRARIKNKIQLISNPWPKQKRISMAHSQMLTSGELPKVYGYSTQMSSAPSTRINSFKVMEFQNNNGGIKVHRYSENKIKPIKSCSKGQKKSQDINNKIQLYDKKPLAIREKTSILDKNNLFLVSFLKNKVKRISKLIEKTSDEVQISKLPHFPENIQTAPIEYKSRALSKRCSSVVGGKRYSRLRSWKGNDNEFISW